MKRKLLFIPMFLYALIAQLIYSIWNRKIIYQKLHEVKTIPMEGGYKRKREEHYVIYSSYFSYIMGTESPPVSIIFTTILKL